MAVTLFSGSSRGVDKLSMSQGDGLTAPKLVSATATDPQTVRVVYDQPMFELSAIEVTSYDLKLMGADVYIHRIDGVSETTYDLRTEELENEEYVLTVSSLVSNQLLIGLDAGFNSATFTGIPFGYPSIATSFYLFAGVNDGIQEEEQTTGWEPSQDFTVRQDDTVTVYDTLPEQPGDRLTRPFRLAYEPVVDLTMVQAALTHRARYYVARGMHDGTGLRPVRYVLGSGGWESPRWGEPPKPSPDATEVVTVVYEDTPVIESANDKTLVVRCEGPVAPSYTVQEILIYARITNSPIQGESFREIPFASATVPAWFHVVGQRFVARIVIPL